jgi:hypothetical protein
MGSCMLLARTLFALVYRIVPIEPGDKSPPKTILGWTRFGHMQTSEQVECLIRSYPDHGVGLVTASTPPLLKLAVEIQKFGRFPLALDAWTESKLNPARQSTSSRGKR